MLGIGGGGGRRGRLDAYQGVTTWTVDPVSGSDATPPSGTSCTVKTCRELARRLDGHVSRAITITLLSAPPSTDPLCLSLVTTPAIDATLPITVTIVGTPTTVRSSTFTAAGTGESGNTAPQVTDSTVSDWTSDVGRWIWRPADSNVHLVAKNMGSNVARVTAPMVFTSLAAGSNPANGAAYEIRTPLAMPIYSRVFFDGELRFQWLDFGSATQSTHNIFAPTVFFIACISPQPLYMNGNWWRLHASCPAGSLGASTSTTGVLAVLYSLILNGDLTIGGGVRGLYQACVVQGRRVRLGAAAAGGVVTSLNLGIFDAAGDALLVQNGGIYNIAGTLYGSGNTTGTAVKQGGQVALAAGVTPTLAATSNELLVDGLSTLPTNLNAGAGGSIPANASLATWALLASNHGRNVCSYLSGARIYAA